jgi:formate dehydrogenase beta subunit
MFEPHLEAPDLEAPGLEGPDRAEAAPSPSELSRRQLLARFGGVGAASCGALAARDTLASPGPSPEPAGTAVGMLYDTTKCIGCKACVVACSEANGLEPETAAANGLWQMPEDLSAQTKNVIKLYKDDISGLTSFVKKQCMHCVDPGCVSGCPFSALTKDPHTGVVSWNASQCIGCRYCEVACPFEVPKFQWDHFNPEIVKCELCDHRLKEGGEPACTEVCPTSAVIFGARKDLLADAKQRLRDAPDRYVHHVYGEHEAGGTQVLYLSHVDFEKIGLPRLSTVPLGWYGSWVHGILYKWLLIPLALYGLFAWVMWKRWNEHEEEARVSAVETGIPPQI